MKHKYTNQLINETSPYLLQHAHNPVNWFAWNDESLSLAKKQNKLIIISVGYAACHWCHVMEHESFENVEVAQVMNRDYISIKVDREERPDIDQVYMNAVQLMTGAGGWPMNVVALPDGRPVWGGTYFKKEQWISVLEQISKLYKANPEKLKAYADQLELGIKNLDIVTFNPEAADFSTAFISKTITNWSNQFDHAKGGMARAPKFMMPNNYHFLLRYAYQLNDEHLKEYVNLTLKQMAFGGVFDQIGGGFSRYSVDDRWHVPHFEKMLYDNAQLVSLYADAFLITKDELYKETTIETLKFISRELTGKDGNFYSSLDADSNNSEGKLEEGAYYVWQKEDLKLILKDDYNLFSDYYNINNYGYWEHNNYVLIRKDEDVPFAKKHNITVEQLAKKKVSWKHLLLYERNKREKPRLDDKTLTSWNALMLAGYADAFRVLGDSSYLKIAIKNAEFILNKQMRNDGGLNHNYKDGKSTINGFLEDYATTINAFISLYELTLNTKWLFAARDLTNYTFDHFFDAQSKMFFFTSNSDTHLVSRSIEYRDNVISASNSIMSKNLFKLSHFFDNEHYSKTSKAMLNNVKPEIVEHGSGYSNWLDLMLNYAEPFYEVAIVGKEASVKVSELNRHYIPNKITVGSIKDESLPLLENRFVENQTFVYVCVNKACKLPVSSVEAAVDQLKNQP
ncbi:MAG: thioredoxin domain-containing protein [Gelidibacter sp.]